MKAILLVLLALPFISCRFRPEIPETESGTIIDDLDKLQEDVQNLDEASASSDPLCAARSGICKIQGVDSCTGSWVSGLCNGANNRRCCIGSTTTTTPSTNRGDSRCVARGGSCKVYASSTCGNWVSNLCDKGPEKCCLPGTNGRIAAPRSYTPPASVISKAQSNPRVPYDASVAWDGGRNCARGIKPWPSIVRARLLSQFPSIITSIGGFACRQNTAAANKMSEHGSGRALDIMVTRYSNGNSESTHVADARGDQIANYLIENASSLGISYLIWNRSSWSQDRRALRAYTGPNGHTDHLHVEFTVASQNRSS